MKILCAWIIILTESLSIRYYFTQKKSRAIGIRIEISRTIIQFDPRPAIQIY
jgi:hypothetical protein